jgi:hypothetical protein
MNPIRFAKSCRKQRQDLEEAYKEANKKNVDDLRAILKVFCVTLAFLHYLIISTDYGTKHDW